MTSFFSLFICILSNLLQLGHCQSCSATQIIFSNNGQQLYIRFNRKVDTTNLLDYPSLCNNYFDTESIQLLSDSTCSFNSILEENSVNSTLLIDLSSTATIQANTESLTLTANAFSCSNMSITLVVNPPQILPNTQINIDSTVATTIASCDTFKISAHSSTDITYRVYDWIWIIRNGIKTQTYSTGQTAELTLQPIDIPYAGKITITIQVHTYLLTSAIKIFEVNKLDLPSPDVNVFGAAQWIYSQPFTFIVSISHTACHFDETLYIFDIKCTAADKKVNTAMVQHANEFYIPSGLMLVGHSYTFNCNVSSDNGELIAPSYGELTVEIISASIIASIAGGNAVQLIRNPLLLDGESLSYSWSSMDGSIANANIQWNCSSVNNSAYIANSRRLLAMSSTTYFSTAAMDCDCPSIVTGESLLNIAANMLQSGCYYKFALDIDYGENTASDSDSVVISAVDSGLSVAIWRDSYCINENNDIELFAMVEIDIENTDGSITIDEYYWDETTNYLDIRSLERFENRLLIPRGFIQPYISYVFALSVTLSDQTTTTSTIDIAVNDAPTITKFDITLPDNNNDNTIEQTYSFLLESFSNYEPNTYQFFWRYDNISYDDADNVALTAIMSSNEVTNIYLPEGDLIITAFVYDLCGGVTSQRQYYTVNHNIDTNISCHAFYNNIVQPLFETAASVKDYNRVLNVFDITTTTINKLNLNNDDIIASHNATNITTTVSPSTSTSTCFSDIVDAFATALETVTVDFDSCVQETTILQQRLVTAIDLVGDDLSIQSNDIFSTILDRIWSGCDVLTQNKLPLCSSNINNGTNNTDQDAKCVNKSSIFSGILTPQQVFRGDQVNEQQVAITLALMDSILASSSLSCRDIAATIYNIFSLLERIVATQFPNDAKTILTSSNKFYQAFVKRVSPQTAVTVSFEDGDQIHIAANVTLPGRELFRSYASGELDSVDIFAIKVKQELLAQCSGELMPDVLHTLHPIASNDEEQCGEILTDIYLIEIDMDGDSAMLTDNITYSFKKTNFANKCDNNIENITSNKQDVTTRIESRALKLCGHYPSVITNVSSELKWDFSGCVFLSESDDVFTCSCNHLSFHSVESIYLIRDIGIPSLLENKYIFYVILSGFGMIGLISLVQIATILLRGYCKLEASVMIYYVLLFGCIFASVSVYSLSEQDTALGENTLLSLDVIISSIRFMILSLLLNTWFRIKMGKKESKSRLERWPLNILIVSMIIYDIICVVIQLTNIDNGKYENVFIIGNLIVNIASGSLAMIWLLWRPVLCVRRCRKKEKIVSATKGYICMLWIILIVICFAYFVQSLLVLFATTKYFDVNSSNTPYVSQWRLINYSIDIISWLIIVFFYICIYLKSTKRIRGNPSQIGAIFKASSIGKRKKANYVENSYSNNGISHIRGLSVDDASSPKKKRKKKKKIKKKRKKINKELILNLRRLEQCKWQCLIKIIIMIIKIRHSIHMHNPL